MLRKLIIFFQMISMTFFSTTVVSCSDKLNIIIKELNNNISDLLFKNTDLKFKINYNNNLNILYWNNFQNNVDNFSSNVYQPNTGLIKPEFRQFFKNLGYKNVDTTKNLLKYLQININKNVGLSNLGLVFSHIDISQNINDNIKITFQNIRMYFNFSDPINGIYKEYYFSDSDNISPNFKNVDIYFPIPKNNLNNETYEEWLNNKDTSNFLNEKLQLLSLKLWFDWSLKPGKIQELLVSGTSLQNIANNQNGLILSKYNIFNLLTTKLFGQTQITSIQINRNNKIISNLKNQILQLDDVLIFKINFSFLDYNENFQINLNIFR